MASSFIRDSATQKWINIFGEVQIIENMNRLVNAMERKIARRAIAKGLKPIVALAKANAPKDSGLLKKAIKSKVTKMVSGKVYVDPKVFAMKSPATGGELKEVKIAGPARGMGWREIRANIMKHSDGKARIKKPANYAHLIEFGTKFKAARPFMRPARELGRAAALAIISDEIRKGLKTL